MNEIVRSVYSNQEDILKGIMRLYCPDGFEVDATYGNGKFYSNEVPRPALCFDIEPLHDGVVEASSTSLPLAEASIGSIVFDPPFLTYVRAGRQGNGKMVMAGRFSGYWRYEELERHYRESLVEAERVLKKGGVMVFKCQDIIHNHRMHCTHANVIEWAREAGLRLADLFILPAKHRLPAPNRNGRQRHARIFHSYFLVLMK